MSKLLMLIIIVMAGFGYFYYNQTQNTILTQQVKIQEQANMLQAFEVRQEEQERTIEALEGNLQKQTAALGEMQKRSNEIQQEMNRYLDIFKRHNLTKLAAAKPGLIEPKVNRATKEVFDAIEADSAALDKLDD